MASPHETSLTHLLGPCACLLSTALLIGGVDARAEPVELSFGVGSATVVRGVALGDGGVDAHAVASFASESGWRAGVGVTALHVKAAPRHWDAQLFWRLGYARRLGDDWSAQAALASYTYPGSDRLDAYARHELGATLAWRDRLYLSIARLHADRSTASDQRHSLAGDIVARQALPGALSAVAGLGRLRGPSYAYTYGHVGLDAHWGATHAQLAYIVTDATAKARFGPAAANRWTVSLGWIF